VFVIFANASFAQNYNMNIKKTDNSTTTILTSDISEITFTWVCGTNNISYAGQTYNTVLIGSQCWLKENLNVGTRIDGIINQTSNSTIEKYCYSDLETNCDTYGGLYQWNEAMQYVATAGTQGICPTGWHIPTETEFQTLGTTVTNNSNALKAIGQGSGSGIGTNTSGFSALLAGGRGHNGGFVSFGDDASFWSSTEYNTSDANYLYLHYNNTNLYFNSYEKITGFSVRCLKD
jgi:uncharacterized protein (TIGR02145 family)